MLRMYFVQQWYGLADEAVEDAIYDLQALRNFMGIDLSRQSVPDATTLMGFRHLLEANDLTKAMLVEVNVMLMERGLLMTQGTLVDATLIAAPSSTINKEHARDPEMHQAKKGNQWHFGMKAHIGVDKDSGLLHTLTTTAANVSDISQTPALLHGQENAVWADAGYVGVDKREDMQEALAGKEQTVQWHVAKRRKSIEKLDDGWQKSLAQACEKLKAQVRVFALSNLDMVRGELRPLSVTTPESPVTLDRNTQKPQNALCGIACKKRGGLSRQSSRHQGQGQGQGAPSASWSKTRLASSAGVMIRACGLL